MEKTRSALQETLREQDRFLAILEITPEQLEAFLEGNECVRWPLALNKDGFGQFYGTGGNVQSAHRASFVLFVGPLPSDQIVYHLCGNAWCVSPCHLRAGSYSDALRQRVRLGRNAAGERHGRARLTWRAVEEIRAAHRTGTTISHLASVFGVNETTIANAVKYKTWKKKPGSTGDEQ